MRLDEPTGDDLAQRPGVLHALDPEPDVAVVDEDLVARLEDGAEDVRRDGKVVPAALLLARDDDGLADLELTRALRGRRSGASAPAGRR